MKDVLPTIVMHEIQDHLRAGCESAEQGWDAGSDEEDTLTGDLGASLRCSWQTVTDQSGETWRWRMTYKKFRGRGAGAAEKSIGADGIVQIELENRRSGETIAKGLLFQAKKVGSRGKKELREQAAQMEMVAPYGGAVFEYGPREYSAADARLFNGHSIGSPDADEAHSRLGDYLAGRFLPCKVGKRGLFYDAIRKMLFVPDETQGVILIRKALRHRLKIEVYHGAR